MESMEAYAEPAIKIATDPLTCADAGRGMPAGGFCITLMAGAGRFSLELRGWAVRLVAEAWPSYLSEWAAIESVAGKLGASAETVRTWVRQAEVDGGQRPGVTSEEAAEIRRRRREVAELRRANEILKAVSAFFAAELDRPLSRS